MRRKNVKRMNFSLRTDHGRSPAKIFSEVDCERSLSFPRVAICEGRARAARSAGAEEKEKERFFPASPHSLFVSFPNLHTINSSARRGFQEQKPTTRSLLREELPQKASFTLYSTALLLDHD